MRKKSKAKKVQKRRGRPPGTGKTGTGRQYALRLHKDFVASVDSWREQQADHLRPSFQGAVRYLTKVGLAAIASGFALPEEPKEVERQEE